MAKKDNEDKVKKDDEELDRLGRGGRGGDNLSEALGDWRDEVRSTKDPREKK